MSSPAARSTSLKAARIEYERLAVPGSLEIPLALSLALANGFVGRAGRHRGCIALGCVIRGETTHYDIVARESAAGLHRLPSSMPCRIGNGILTCDSREQALGAGERRRAQQRRRRRARLPHADAARAAFLLGEPALMTAHGQKKPLRDDAPHRGARRDSPPSRRSTRWT